MPTTSALGSGGNPASWTTPCWLWSSPAKGWMVPATMPSWSIRTSFFVWYGSPGERRTSMTPEPMPYQ